MKIILFFCFILPRWWKSIFPLRVFNNILYSYWRKGNCMVLYQTWAIKNSSSFKNLIPCPPPIWLRFSYYPISTHLIKEQACMTVTLPDVTSPFRATVWLAAPLPPVRHSDHVTGIINGRRLSATWHSAPAVSGLVGRMILALVRCQSWVWPIRHCQRQLGDEWTGEARQEDPYSPMYRLLLSKMSSCQLRPAWPCSS